MIVEYDDEAIAEAMEAAAWYERRQDGLVRRFLGKWKEAERRMAADPELNRTFQSDYRRCRFDVFPYALIYRIASEDTLNQGSSGIHPPHKGTAQPEEATLPAAMPFWESVVAPPPGGSE